MAYIFAYLAFWISCFFCRSALVKETQNSAPVVRILVRAFLNTLCFGVGVIGGDGFGLPGPITAALIFYNRFPLYLYTAIYPFIFWFALFLLGQYISEKNLVDKLNEYLKRKKLTNNWMVFLILIFIGITVLSSLFKGPTIPGAAPAAIINRGQTPIFPR